VMESYCNQIKGHYVSVWRVNPTVRRWEKGPIWELPSSFCVLEFPPSAKRELWTYATCCMSQPEDSELIELHLFGHSQYEPLVELLTVVAHYHHTSCRLGLNDTVNFGRPWMNNSRCDYGMISLPYLDGPELENFSLANVEKQAKFYWLIPITHQEREYKMKKGLEALESRFEQVNFDYADPHRSSVV
jgi:hypothetical protein